MNTGATMFRRSKLGVAKRLACAITVAAHFAIGVER
jgi:hypothetical protein